MARHKTSRNGKHYLRQGVDPRVTQDRDLDLTNSQKKYILPQSNQQHKTKQNNLVGVVLLSVKKTTTTTTTTTPEWLHVKPLPGNLGSWFLVCSLIIMQLEEIWKTTSIFWKMEDDLNFLFFLGRRPQFLWKWKTA